MAYFVIFLLILVPCLLVLPALLNRSSILVDNPKMQNTAVALQRLEELSVSGDEVRQEAENEVKASLVEDVKSVKSVTFSLMSPAKSLVVIFLLPLFAVTLYLHIGQPELLRGNQQEILFTGQDPDNPPDVNQLLAQLEQRIAEQPDNPRGWELAARTYISIEQYDKAEQAYTRLNALVPGNPDFLAGWADATIMANGNSYSPKARTLVQQALAINPSHQNALWIAALGASSLGDYENAISYLEALLEQVSNEPETTVQLNRLINHNRSLAGNMQNESSSSKPGPGKIIDVTVSLDPGLATGLQGSEIVFVIARAQNGPAAPLAVSRHRLEELPLEISLNREHAMIANMTVDNFDELQILARVSRSGIRPARSGDYASQVVSVSGENPEPVSVVIDRVVE